MRKSHADELDGNCVSKTHAIEFFKENKVEFGLKYVRGDMALWSEYDMILVAVLSRSSASKEFRKELATFIKANAKKGMVEQDVHTRVIMELGRQAVEIEELKRFVGLKNESKRVELRIVS